jgi:hypothetical protein
LINVRTLKNHVESDHEFIASFEIPFQMQE